MVKKLPLKRRLEVTLQSISSNSEKKVVYGKLAEFVDTNINDCLDADSFYQRLNVNTLMPDNSHYDRETIEKGRLLSEYLDQSITLPTPQETPKYRQKMINAMKHEFKFLKRYNNDE